MYCQRQGSPRPGTAVLPTKDGRWTVPGVGRGPRIPSYPTSTERCVLSDRASRQAILPPKDGRWAVSGVGLGQTRYPTYPGRKVGRQWCGPRSDKVTLPILDERCVVSGVGLGHIRSFYLSRTKGVPCQWCGPRSRPGHHIHQVMEEDTCTVSGMGISQTVSSLIRDGMCSVRSSYLPRTEGVQSVVWAWVRQGHPTYQGRKEMQSVLWA